MSGVQLAVLAASPAEVLVAQTEPLLKSLPPESAVQVPSDLKPGSALSTMISSAEAGVEAATGAVMAMGAAGAAGAAIGVVVAASGLDVCVCWQAVSNTDIAAIYDLFF